VRAAADKATYQILLDDTLGASFALPELAVIGVSPIIEELASPKVS
jgi:hypothetical protein